MKPKHINTSLDCAVENESDFDTFDAGLPSYMEAKEVKGSIWKGKGKASNPLITFHFRLERVEKKLEELNRKKDMVCFLLSYPSFNSMNKERHKGWILDVLDVNHKHRQLKTITEDIPALEMLSSMISGLLDHSIDDIEAYVPPRIINEMKEGIYWAGKLKKGVCNLVFDFAIRQLLEALENPEFQVIRLSGSDHATFMSRLKNLPRIREMFNIFLYVDGLSHRYVRDIEDSIARQLGLSTWSQQEVNEFLKSKNFLLHLNGDCSSEDLYKVGANLWNPKYIQKMVHTPGTHPLHLFQKTDYPVDLEVRLQDHRSLWELFYENVGYDVVHSSSIKHLAVHVFKQCNGHFFATLLIARALKGVSNVRIWEYASHSLDLLPASETEDRILFNALAFILWRLGSADKCAKHCASHLEREGKNKVDLIEKWIQDSLVGTRHQGEVIVEDLVNALLLDSFQNGNSVRMQDDIRKELVNLFKTKMKPKLLELGGRGLTEAPKDEAWEEVSVMHLMNNKISKLPGNPNCPRLGVLCLQENHHLRVIPQFFFERMSVLQIIDLSYTRIRSLPQTLFKLVQLRKFLLRGCELFKELPREIGELLHLEVLDLEGTEIINLPVTVGKLQGLSCLKVSFYGYNSRSRKNNQPNIIIPQNVISKLLRLEELSIDVNPEDERWNMIAKDVVKEVCSLKRLEILKLYLPEVVLLNEFRNGTSSTNLSLKNFRFIFGNYMKRMISRLPSEPEVKFEKQERCLKYVNGDGVPNEIKEVLQHATALFLDRHSTVTSLSEFGIQNMDNLNFCLLKECNEIQTMVDAVNEDVVLGSLKYLNLHYMRNLRSIWKGPLNWYSLAQLKSLVLNTCPRLTTIFTIDLLENMYKLEELVVEDCPEIKCLLSHEATAEGLNSRPRLYLPRLKKISLHYLPNLESISGGWQAPCLEWMSFFDCPKLKTLSGGEVSIAELKVILGEAEWWRALEWNEADKLQPSNLDSIFVPIERDRDLKTQSAEIHNKIQAGRQQIQPYGQSESGDSDESDYYDSDSDDDSWDWRDLFRGE